MNERWDVRRSLIARELLERIEAENRDAFEQWLLTPVTRRHGYVPPEVQAAAPFDRG